jgi:ATP-binding cassette subfamily G (WHITE) protein 2 (PDR)
MSAALSIEKAAENEASTAENVNVNLSSDSDYGTADENMIGKKHDEEIVGLARKFSTNSAQNDLGSPFDAPEGGGLDPRSDQFRAKDWARAFYNLRYGSGEALPRVAGVAFRNLNVWGKGSPTDFQSTVGNKILKLPSLFGHGSQRIEILRDLDGLILPGEQLCVLGPPG